MISSIGFSSESPRFCLNPPCIATVTKCGSSKKPSSRHQTLPALGQEPYLSIHAVTFSPTPPPLGHCRGESWQWSEAIAPFPKQRPGMLSETGWAWERLGSGGLGRRWRSGADVWVFMDRTAKTDRNVCLKRRGSDDVEPSTSSAHQRLTQTPFPSFSLIRNECNGIHIKIWEKSRLG